MKFLVCVSPVEIPKSLPVPEPNVTTAEAEKEFLKENENEKD